MLCWARYSLIVVVIALGTLSMVDACGQRGPLYLPKPDAQQAPAKGAGKGSEVPKTPAPAPAKAPLPAQAPDSEPGLTAWPAERPDGCTSGCAEGGN